MKKKITALMMMLCTLSVTCVMAVMPMASQKEVQQYEKAVLLTNEGKYKEALPIFRQLVRENKKFVNASWGLADLHGKMGNSGKKIEALKYVANPKLPNYNNTIMRLGNAYFETCNYEECIATYKIIPESTPMYYKTAQKRIKDCETAIKLRSKPRPYQATNMGTKINTIYDDYWPSITADESLFSTTVMLNKVEGQSTFGKNLQEEIFISRKDDNNQWTLVENVGPSINTKDNEGAQSFSLDGRYMFFVACDRQDGYGGCDIYYSMRIGNKWTKAKNAGPVINSRAWETDPSFSPTGDKIYFASNRKEGSLGGSDIWESDVTMNQDGTLTFGKPRNLGPNINTSEDELSPFIHADNQTLFFSSKGWEGLGDYDIFVSYKNEEGKWEKAQNIGYPLNTCHDEIGFVVNAHGDKAYYSSNGLENNGRGRDIYEIKLQEGNLKPRSSMKYVKGKVVDSETHKPIQAMIDVYSVNTNKKVFRGVSDLETGEFVTCQPEGEEVGVDVDRKGYLFYSGHADEKSHLKFEKEGVKMEKIEVGKKIVLKNIFFDFDKATLRPASHHELDMLVKFMKENPTVKIKLCGHTDIVGNKEYNKELSQKRALAAYDYLVKHRIMADRLKYEGYGSDRPIGDNKTAEGRQLNRRTEVEIIAK